MATSTSYNYLSSSNSSSESENEECRLEVADFSVSKNSFTKVLNNLFSEELIMKSSKGKNVLKFADALVTSQVKEVGSFSDYVNQQIHFCFEERRKMSLHKLWWNFHVLRLSENLKSKWLSCVGVLHLPEDVLSVADLVLQILLKRMFQNVIQELTAAPAQTQSPAEELMPRDENVVRCMAGYVLHQLKKKYPQHSGFFSDILADGTLDFDVQTIEDYSRVWVEQVDRGSLCKVNDNFFTFLKEMEHVCRKHLDVRILPVEPLMSRIKEDILNNCSSSWRRICSNTDSSMLLEYIANLWINIRVYSFKHWADRIQAKKAAASTHSKALRKTLKHIGSEKDSTR